MKLEPPTRQVRMDERHRDRKRRWEPGPFMLNGIPTAMHWDGLKWTCGCGWSTVDIVIPMVDYGAEDILNALRFHYTHCERAKLPGADDPEPAEHRRD